MTGHGQQSLLLRPMPTELPKVQVWRVKPRLPAPRGVEESLFEKFGYNDIDETWSQKATYERWVQPSQEELAKMVEYDMNDADKMWLDARNAERKKDNIEAISYEAFEIIMDKLEKEWFDLQKHVPKPVSNMQVEDSKCAICDDGECEASNAIVFCDGCNLAVHQDCYGVPYIPEGQWLCRKCTVSPDRPVSCLLCPGHHGAFKQTVNGQWAHLLCAIWINETCVNNTVYMEPIDGIEAIPKQRWKLICNLCRKRTGACIQCSKSSCYTAYHVTCAREHGLDMRLGTSSGATTADGSPGPNVSYCDKHSKKKKRKDSDDNDRRDVSEELEVPPSARLLDRKKKGMKLQSYGDRHGSSTPLSASFVDPDDSFASGSRENSITFDVPPPRPGAGTIAPAELPVVPRYVYDKVWDYIRPLKCQKKKATVALICRYWSLKRLDRRGAPLLKRLHLEPWTAASGSRDATDVERGETLQMILLLRKDLERVRNIVELTRRRESEKLRRAHLFKHVIDRIVYPRSAFFRGYLHRLQALDARHLFLKPVSKIDVPDYFAIVKNPMDWQTMHEKLDRNAYVTASDFQIDARLIVHNALIYNTAESTHGKAARKLNMQMDPILQSLSEFDDPHSEVHKKHRRYLDLLDADWLKNLMKLNYPLPDASEAIAPVPTEEDLMRELSTAALPRDGIPDVLTGGQKKPVFKKGKKRKSYPAGFKSLAVTSASGGVSLPEGFDQMTPQQQKMAIREASLAKRRAEGKIYREKRRARILAQKEEALRIALPTSGGRRGAPDPEPVASTSAMTLDNESQSALAISESTSYIQNLIPKPESTADLQDTATYTTSEMPSVSVPSGNIQDVPQTLIHDDRNVQAITSQIAPGDLPDAGSIVGTDPDTKVETPALALFPSETSDTTIDTGEPISEVNSEGRQRTSSGLATVNPPLLGPIVSEWGASVIRTDVPSDHESNLLFNTGWILPDGQKRRRSTSARTDDTTIRPNKARKRSLPPPSMSPILGAFASMPNSAPMYSIPLPPVQEQFPLVVAVPDPTLVPQIDVTDALVADTEHSRVGTNGFRESAIALEPASTQPQDMVVDDHTTYNTTANTLTNGVVAIDDEGSIKYSVEITKAAPRAETAVVEVAETSLRPESINHSAKRPFEDVAATSAAPEKLKEAPNAGVSGSQNGLEDVREESPLSPQEHDSSSATMASTSAEVPNPGEKFQRNVFDDDDDGSDLSELMDPEPSVIDAIPAEGRQEQEQSMPKPNGHAVTLEKDELEAAINLHATEVTKAPEAQQTISQAGAVFDAPDSDLSDLDDDPPLEEPEVSAVAKAPSETQTKGLPKGARSSPVKRPAAAPAMEDVEDEGKPDIPLTSQTKSSVGNRKNSSSPAKTRDSGRGKAKVNGTEDRSGTRSLREKSREDQLQDGAETTAANGRYNARRVTPTRKRRQEQSGLSDSEPASTENITRASKSKRTGILQGSGRNPVKPVTSNPPVSEIKPSRSISKKKLAEVYYNKPIGFISQRLRYLDRFVHYKSYEEVADYDLVWARPNKSSPFWPAEVCLDPAEREELLPDHVLGKDPSKKVRGSSASASAKNEEDDAQGDITMTKKSRFKTFDHYLLVNWFPQTDVNPCWSWIPFDPEYVAKFGESKELDHILQTRYDALKSFQAKPIQVAYEDCFSGMETPPPSDDEEELQDFSALDA